MPGSSSIKPTRQVDIILEVGTGRHYYAIEDKQGDVQFVHGPVAAIGTRQFVACCSNCPNTVFRSPNTHRSPMRGPYKPN
jgi:hypothetical protein